MKGNIYGLIKRKLSADTVKVMDSLEGVESPDILLMAVKLQYADIVKSMSNDKNEEIEKRTHALNNLKSLICEYENLKARKSGLDMREHQAEI